MNTRPARAFTVVELLVATTVLVILMGLMTLIVGQVGKAGRHVSNKIDAFQAARSAFDTLTQTLSQATLNTYLDYDAPSKPTTYLRKSNLRFLVVPRNGGLYFQAPISYSYVTNYAHIAGLLNGVGYYVAYGDDSARRPSYVSKTRWRYRLMQGIAATESLAVYSDAAWTNGVNAVAWPMADNIVSLVVWPRLSPAQDAAGTQLASDYSYDSGGTIAIQQAQLPPVVQVTAVAISEASAARLCVDATPPSAITAALQGRFVQASQYSQDVAAVRQALGAAHVECEILSGSIPLRESKWSSTP